MKKFYLLSMMLIFISHRLPIAKFLIQKVTKYTYLHLVRRCLYVMRLAGTANLKLRGKA